MWRHNFFSCNVFNRVTPKFECKHNKDYVCMYVCVYVCVQTIIVTTCLYGVSTNPLPVLTAVTLMRCVVILWDVTHAHVKQDSQAMKTPALPSRLIDTFVFWVIRQQHNNTTLFICTLLGLPIMFWLDGKKKNYTRNDRLE